ncbi:hypothetical protein [Solimonas terrae]|uniref:Tetratricopeptide repeat protein n=1 Tax=Solimonas terrae TaxID=1396819 RepID=A0A6M2BMV0_9GAMM|nr:hypothetical protein [Solimonas terrae]NGY03417.1 hypothetical protein [Solimonas terrae]
MSASALDLSLRVRQANPDRGTTLVLGSALHDAVLRDISVQIDDDAPITYQFSEDEAHALNGGGFKYLSSLPPEAAGAHRLRAEFRARADTGKPHATLVTAQLDRSFNTAAATAVLVLTAQSGSLVSSASMDLQAGGSDPLPNEAEVLLAGGRPFEALVLFSASNRSDPVRVQAARAALGLAESGETAPVLSHYNAAVAKVDAAQDSALQQLADASAADAQGLAVRDLSNLTLGYRALQDGQVDLAADRFRQVRSPGPYSSAAMLGLGWSCLLPQADKAAPIPVSLRPASADAMAVTRRQTPFRYLQAVVDGKRADDLRRALVPWSELIGRDPLDPAVEEGMLVIPYALDHLGAHAQAQDYYQRAVDRLHGARQTLAAARQEVDDGRMLAELDARDADTGSGWPRLLVERHGDSAAVPLRVLIEDPQVAAPLHDYRQLQAIDRALAADRAHLADHDESLLTAIDALRARIALARGTVAADARQALDASLQARDRDASRYLAEAEFALARIDDRVPHGVSAP